MLASMELAEHLNISFLTRKSFCSLPLVIQILKIVPLRRHLRRGAVALLLFKVPGNIFHGGEVQFYLELESVVEFFS